MEYVDTDLNSLDELDELDEEKMQTIIGEILSGERVVSVDNNTYIFKYPLNKLRQRSIFLENQLIEIALEEGYLSEDNLPEELAEEVFSIEEAERLQEVEKKIEGLSLVLKKRIKGTDIYIRDLEGIENLKSEKESLLIKKGSTSQYSAEYKSREEKYMYLLSQCTYSLDNKLVWEDYNNLLEKNTAEFVYKLLNAFLDFYWGYSTEIVRKIARSGHWRVIYLSAKSGIFNLTEVSAKDVSMLLLQLMSWTMYYNNISEMLTSDRPSDEVIENDTKLDQFMEEYTRRMSAEAEVSRKKENRSRGNLSSSALDKDQVVVTAESNQYVSFHKNDVYSDPEIIKGRIANDSDSSQYSEIKEAREIRNRNRSRRKNRNKR